VFKKALKIAVSFCLLVGAYAGYTRLFAIVTYHLMIAHDDGVVPFPEFESTSAKRATELARESFGRDFFASRNDLKLQYYEAARGLYMYAQNKKILNDGKRIHVWPFAMIWISKDGKSRKIATSDEAIIDLSQPFMQVKPSTEPSKISHAKMIGDVRLRDDKGTRDDPYDDLRVGPLSDLEFDDTTLQITTDSDVFLQDRDLTLTGIGMMIQLRRKVGPPDPNGVPGAPSGFDAETADVWKDVHIVVKDVTSDGVLPGKAKPEKSGKTPIDVRSDLSMHIILPKPRPTDVVGPPNLNRPPDPTFVKFKTNVRVIRGTDKTEQLNCDTLDLTMMPDPMKPGSEQDEEEGQDGEESAKSDGPLNEQKIRVALARGHDVWLQSEAQGMVARCVELRYEKHAFEGLPDITYLNGGTGKKLMVEKVDYDARSPVPGTIKSIMKLTSLDATIFESGGSSKVIARGPGTVKERPARNASVTREVWFEDEMEMLTWHDGVDPAPMPSPLAVRALSQVRPEIPRGTLRRLLTLSGVSKLIDLNTSTTLDARKSIVAEFQAVPNAPPLKGDGPAEIKWLDAYEDAHLTAPSKILTARQFLKARFEQAPAPPKPIALAPVPGPGIAAGPAPAPLIAAASPTLTPSPTGPKPEPDLKPIPVEPLVDGRADRVWACVQLASTGEGSANSNTNSKGELKDAQLRGGVIVHQDPKVGEPFGSDASGEALDLTAQGDGLMKFVVKREEPQAFDPKTRLASSSSKGRASLTLPLSRVDFKGKTIESEDIIGLDQKLDFAWSQGAGLFTQMADRGLLDDKGIEGEKVQVVGKPNASTSTKQVGPSPKDRLAISWTSEMRFYGKSVDLEGRPAAKIEFRGESRDVRTTDGKIEFRRGVEAKMTDSAIYTDTMDVYMDRIIVFKDAEKKPAANPDDPTPPDPQIAMLDCKGKDIIEDSILKHPGVDIITQKLLPGSGELKEKQRIQGQHVIYDKRTGNFHAPGAGMAWLYRRKGKGNADAPIPTAFPAASSNGRRPEVVLADKKPPMIELTKIKFSLGMQGRFGVAKDKADNERRDAEFYGDVQAANASVSTKNSDIDFDRLTLWPDYVFLTSDVLNVFSIPLPAGSDPPNKQLLDARGNALTRAKFDTIQADRITYNSASALAYGYGYDGKEVSITKQDSPGQRPTTSRGKTVLYNKDTRQSKIDDPQALSFVDLKSGIRSKPFFPELGGSPKPLDPKPQPRVPLQRQGKVSTERNGFTGH
jgi:hypothetical protein